MKRKNQPITIVYYFHFVFFHCFFFPFLVIVIGALCQSGCFSADMRKMHHSAVRCVGDLICQLFWENTVVTVVGFCCFVYIYPDATYTQRLYPRTLDTCFFKRI